MSNLLDTASTPVRHRRSHAGDGGFWWDEVAHVREGIERRRDRESLSKPRVGRTARRTVSIGARSEAVADVGPTRPAAAVAPVRVWQSSAEPLALGYSEVALQQPWPAVPAARERRRERLTPAEWLESKPDRMAAWAVALGFLLVLAGILSSH